MCRSSWWDSEKILECELDGSFKQGGWRMLLLLSSSYH